MLKQVYEIDEFSLLKSILVIEFDEQGNCTEELAENIITEDIPQGLYRAKWTGTEWVEDMPQAEIDAMSNATQSLTEIERLRLEQAHANTEMIDLMMAMMGGM